MKSKNKVKFSKNKENPVFQGLVTMYDMPMDDMPMEGMQTPQEFSEDEPLNIVFERLGITMEQFLRCVYENADTNTNENGMNSNIRNPR